MREQAITVAPAADILARAGFGVEGGVPPPRA